MTSFIECFIVNIAKFFARLCSLIDCISQSLVSKAKEQSTLLLDRKLIYLRKEKQDAFHTKRTSALDAILFSYHAAGSTNDGSFVRGGYQPRPQGLLVIQYGGGGRESICATWSKQTKLNGAKCCCRWSVLHCLIICKVLLTRYNVERDCNRALSYYTNSVYPSRHLPKIWIWTGFWREFVEFKIWNFYGKKSRLWMFGVKAKWPLKRRSSFP